jgi:20S proteasome subunit beta 1
MQREDCEAFVTRAVSHAMARDGSSGGVIRLCTINKEGVHRSFTPGNEVPYRMEA